MIPNLPRPLLWTEKTSMEAFIEDDPVNLWFHGCYSELPHSLTSRVGELKFFNEVYYQLTRICYEHPHPEDLPRYAASIEEDLGWVFSVDLVMSMMYFYARYRGLLHSDPIDHFFRCIWRRYSNSELWGLFSQSRRIPEIYEHHRIRFSWTRTPVTPYPLNPCPMLPEELIEANFDWSAITKDYHPDIVNEVINLWMKEEDKEVMRAKLFLEESGVTQLLLGKLLEERKTVKSLKARVSELENEIRQMKTMLEQAKEPMKEQHKEDWLPALDLLHSMIKNHVNGRQHKDTLRPYKAALEAEALPLWGVKEFNKMTGAHVSKSSYSKCIMGADAYKPEELAYYIDQFTDLSGL